jgi:hypothetical protein
MSVTPVPFRIAIGDDVIADLNRRLDGIRWPCFAEGVGWRYGIGPDYARSLVQYWRRDFDWRAQEAALNVFPQFVAEIDRRRVHFVHLRGKGPSPLPLILSHGWPSSFVEWLAVADKLADPARHGDDARDAFDVIIPVSPWPVSPWPVSPWPVSPWPVSPWLRRRGTAPPTDRCDSSRVADRPETASGMNQ